MKIGVIDDEKVLLQTFSSLMRQFGYDAEFFSDPVKASEIILQNPQRYSLLIVDIKMPGMDGVTFVKKVRTVVPNLPIIFMTGGVSEDKEREAKSIGNILYLEKPFPLADTLKTAIPKLLAARPSK
ncbi:MAG: response regulator [Candidatus Omnitrophota bacterium]